MRRYTLVMAITHADEALRVAENVADLITLAQEKQTDRSVTTTVARILERVEQGEESAVRFSHAAQILNVTRPTIQLWVERGVLEEVPSRPRKVSSLSLGRALALVRQLGKTDEGRERLLRALESLRDRDLLTRARQIAEETKSEDRIVYDEAALAELRRG